MEREKHCLLCWKPLNVGDSLIGVHEHYEQLINCCKKLLKDDHKNELNKLEFREGDPLPFCFDCFTYSEKLYEIQKQLKDLRKCLKGWIDVFSTGISNSRMLFLPKNTNSPNFYDHLNIKKESDDSQPTTLTRPTDETSDKCNSTVQLEKSIRKGKSKKSEGLGQTVVQNLLPADTDIIICDISNSMSFIELESDGNTNVKRTSKRNKFDLIVSGESADKSLLRKRKAKLLNLEEQEQFDQDSRQNSNSKRRKSEGNQDVFEMQEQSSRPSSYEMDNSPAKENTANDNQNLDKTGSIPIVELFKCSVCNSEFFLHRNLILHGNETGHVTEKSESCPQCEKTFYRKRDCEWHIKNIHNFQPHNHPCKVCGNTFFSYEELIVHVRSHTKKSRVHSHVYKCSICYVKWMSMSALFKHMSANHSDVEPYKCDKCNILYYTEETFNVHKSSHNKTQSDEEHYQSQSSGWTFATIEEINRRDDKPCIPLKKLVHGFSCEVCDIFLDKNKDFQHHLTETGHANAKEIKCTGCNKEFYRVCDLRGHKSYCKINQKRKLKKSLKLIEKEINANCNDVVSS